MALMVPLSDLVDAHPDGLLTLPEVQKVTGVSRGALRTAIDDGLITPTGVRKGKGRGGGAYTLTAEDAVFLAACAALAIAAGIAFVTMVKAMRATNAQVNPAAGTVTVPLPPLP